NAGRDARGERRRERVDAEAAKEGEERQRRQRRRERQPGDLAERGGHPKAARKAGAAESVLRRDHGRPSRRGAEAAEPRDEKPGDDSAHENADQREPRDAPLLAGGEQRAVVVAERRTEQQSAGEQAERGAAR